MTRAVALTSARGGIDRTRIKGGAKPENLYDGVNCWVTVSQSLRPRQGSVVDAQLPAGTIGLTTFEEKLVVFSDHAVDMTGFPDYQLEILTYPGGPSDDAPTLVKIHFAEPYLGYLYVSAEWSDGTVWHYWLQAVSTWQPNHIYMFNELVQPTVPNGYTYRANRLNPANPVWTPDTAVSIGDIKEPTVANGYQYEVIDTYGASPRTGTVEPDWVAADGAIVNEDVDISAPTPPTESTPGTSAPPQEVIDRYGIGPNAPTSGRQEAQ